jgi:hypothetical protein
VLVIRDEAAAWAAAARVAKNKKAESRAKVIRVRAEFKAGELSAKIRKAAGGDRRSKNQPRHNAEFEPKQAVLERHGVSSEEASQWERLAKVAKADIEAAPAAVAPHAASFGSSFAHSAKYRSQRRDVLRDGLMHSGPH